MLTLHLQGLIVLGVMLLLASLVLRPNVARDSWRNSKIVAGLRRLLRLFGGATLIAAGILICLPVFKPQDLSDDSLRVLNETLERYSHLLEKSWIVLVASLLCLLGCAWLGWIRIHGSQANATRRTVKAVAALKVLVSLLACFTFVGSGLKQRIDQRVSEVKEAKNHLESVQVELFLKLNHAIQREVVSETIQDISNRDAAFQHLADAYQVVASYSPERSTVYETKSAEGFPRSEQTPRSSHPSENVKIEDLYDPDLTPSRASAMVSSIDNQNAEGARDLLVEDTVHLVFDNTVSDAVKKYILQLGNPILSELVGVLLDPTFAEPVERWINQQARTALKSGLNMQQIRQAVSSSLAGAKSVVVDHVVQAARNRLPRENQIGIPEWNNVREALHAAVERGLNGKGAEIQDQARASLTRLDMFWRAARTIFSAGESRQERPEKLFSEYLAKNPDYAALWGYAVISFPPEEYKGDLKTIATGRLDDIEAALRHLVVRRDKGFLDAEMKLAKIDPDRTLQVSSPSALYRQVWYEHDGPHPVDGYVLYQQKVAGITAPMASSYFNGPAVGKFVGDYCPRT